MPESGVAMLHPIHCLPGPQVSNSTVEWLCKQIPEDGDSHVMAT